jgi:hypothetical protein
MENAVGKSKVVIDDTNLAKYYCTVRMYVWYIQLAVTFSLVAVPLVKMGYTSHCRPSYIPQIIVLAHQEPNIIQDHLAPRDLERSGLNPRFNVLNNYYVDTYNSSTKNTSGCVR